MSAQSYACTQRSDALEPAHPWQQYTTWQRWTFLGVLFLVATANYFDYFILAVLLEPIKREFHVSDTILGILSGLCFALVYSAAALPMARWADRGNRRTVITLALTAWSIMTTVCGLAHSFWQLALARFGVGAAEPGALPAAQSLAVDYFPPGQRATALSILVNGGSAAGWLVGIGLGGYIAATHGWRATFVAAGGLSLTLALATHRLLPEPRVGGAPIGHPTSEGIGRTIRWLWRKRSFVWGLLGLTLYTIYEYGVMMFVPSFLQRSFGASLEQVSIAWGSIMSVANIGGAVAGGLLADRLGRRDIRWYAWVPALGCALALPLYALAFRATRLWTFIDFEFLAEWSFSMGIPIVFALASSVSGSARRAMATAGMFCAISLLGTNLGPLLVGALSDALHPSYGADSLRPALSVMLVFLLPATVALIRAGQFIEGELEP